MVEFQRTCFQVPEIPKSWIKVKEAQPEESVRYPSPPNPVKLVGWVVLPKIPPKIENVIGAFLTRLS